MARKQKNEQAVSHPAHPVRNFLYMLWSILNAFAFAGLFFALATPTLPYRGVLVIAFATLTLAALVFGVLRPLFRGR